MTHQMQRLPATARPIRPEAQASWEQRFAEERARRIQLEREILRMKAKLQRTRIDVVSARQMALHDELTLLPNRTLFRERVRAALMGASQGVAPVAVLYLDLNGFKLVNDTYGHAVGDKVLNIIGTRLGRAVRSQDTVARLGGDEFACLLTGLTGQLELRQRAGQVIKAVSARLKIGDHLVHIDGSAGVAVSPADGNNVDELLKSADEAMYRAKKMKEGGARSAVVSLPKTARPLC